MSMKEKYKALISTLLNAWGGKATVKSAKSVEINGTAHNPAAVVVETWTAADGLSWYRKYSDGWIEQGGEFTKPRDTNVTVTFPVAFKTTNYTIATSQYARLGSNGPGCDFTAKSTTGFTHNYGSWGSKWGWLACGF